MPAFAASDGTQLAYHVVGEGEPLLCLPGGPMRASAYLGDLGGLSERRRLIKLDLRGTGDSALPADPATYRCDRQVADVEALRVHLGLDRVDLLAHSAAGDLALLYAARHPQRVRTLTLITARARALGVDFTEAHRREAAALRTAEPWFGAAYDAYERVWAGSVADADWDAIIPFFYGRWDAAAQAHAASDVAQTHEEAAEIYASGGAFAASDEARAAVAGMDARVLLLVGEVDSGPLPRIAADIAQLIPRAELVVQPGAGHYPWLDDPGRFTRTVMTFLGQEPAEFAV
ncbi:alpha/beta hydrolase [Streptomyces sp. RPA4-5]|uniref:alpha/beta fold hydrolase n=1 Tax=Streptomyces TaxID=1883 RepID=UPI00143E4725|nr:MULTISPECIES: alpha/beta hydrolase [Streptomyces]MCX4635413.1 alpha/beta hydrolase [Streptomyces platensis]QIY58563.1 alpha/beta hydrolase [Streptomyces sp. RPA4-5]WJY41810.1 alpha/beta hydrolase [Streptomyces sp. P9-2B-2]